MKIGEIIENRWNEINRYVKRRDNVISINRTPEDVLQDVLLMALRKFKDEDITEDEGYSYIKKSLAMELVFQYKKKEQGEILMEDWEGPIESPLYNMDIDRIKI